MNVKKLNVNSAGKKANIEQNEYRHNDEIKNEKGEVIGKVVKLNPYKLGFDFACSEFVRIDGKEYRVGEKFYDGRITAIMPLERVIIIDGYIAINFDWLGGGNNE